MPQPGNSPRRKKVVIMGFKSVGKSCLLMRFVHNTFVDLHNPTIEDTFEKYCQCSSRTYLLEVVDTAGQDEFTIFPDSYTINIHGYILIYSVNDRRSFNVIKHIHRKLLDITAGMNVPLVLVGNKTDKGGERQVEFSEGIDLAKSWKAEFMEVSAKENVGISTIFSKMLLEIERSEGIFLPDPPAKKCILS